MTEQKWLRQYALLSSVTLLTALELSACMARTIESEAMSPAGPSANGAADRTVQLPSGATLKVAADWTVTASPDGLTLEDPERRVKIELVEVDATPGLSAAIVTAWARRRQDFNRRELAASDSPGREGWDLFRWTRYETSPNEARRVSALAAQKGSLAVVALFDGALAAAQRRSAQITLTHESLRPAGYVRETYRGRTPRTLDAARIAQLKTFVDRMRDAADVPGLSVALFDRHGTLLEEGFGVRERGRDERVTADTLYMIASNTKALTTLMLARLVDEGRFEWDTPVTHVYPSCLSHGGSMFGYKSNFFFVPDAGVGGVILTNADSGGRVAMATIARTLEVLYDGKPEAEESLLSGVRETRVFLEGQQRNWTVPPDPSEVQRLASSYRNAALGEIVVQKGTDGVVFQFGGWTSRVGTRANPDGTTTFISVDPGIRGFEFNARAANGVYKRLRLGDAQHIYEYEAQDQGGSSR